MADDAGRVVVLDEEQAALGDGVHLDAVHVERFGAPRKIPSPRKRTEGPATDSTTVTVIMDGHRKTFAMARNGDNIVDVNDLLIVLNTWGKCS